MVRSEILKSSQLLFTFLSASDPKLWDSAVKAQDKQKPAQGGFQSVIAEEGQVNTQILQPSLMFSTKMPQFIESQKTVFQEAIDVSKEINVKCKSLQSSFH